MNEQFLQLLQDEPHDFPLTDLNLAITLNTTPRFVRHLRHIHNIPQAPKRRKIYGVRAEKLAINTAQLRAEQDVAYIKSLKKDEAKAQAEAKAEAVVLESKKQKEFLKTQEGKEWVRGQRLNYFLNLTKQQK
tara:strand:- start:3327 stop:3722 length:396 start_codon:yes stop_codon:yes gene_type:complete